MSTETSQVNTVPPMEGLNQTLSIELVEAMTRASRRHPVRFLLFE